MIAFVTLGAHSFTKHEKIFCLCKMHECQIHKNIENIALGITVLFRFCNLNVGLNHRVIVLTSCDTIIGWEWAVMVESRIFKKVTIKFCVLDVKLVQKWFCVSTTKLVCGQASTIKLKKNYNSLNNKPLTVYHKYSHSFKGSWVAQWIDYNINNNKKRTLSKENCHKIYFNLTVQGWH